MDNATLAETSGFFTFVLDEEDVQCVGHVQFSVLLCCEACQ